MWRAPKLTGFFKLSVTIIDWQKLDLPVVDLLILFGWICSTWASLHPVSGALETRVLQGMHRSIGMAKIIRSQLVGGWTNPFEKYARQIGSFPQGSGWKLKKNELPPPRQWWSGIMCRIWVPFSGWSHQIHPCKNNLYLQTTRDLSDINVYIYYITC